MQQTESSRIQDGDEICLLDILHFFYRNGKFIAVTTIGLSAAAIALFLIQPKSIQYQKQLTLSLRPAPTPVSGFPVIDVNQASTLAVQFVKNSKLNQLAGEPKYDPITQQIAVTLASSNLSMLNDTGSKVVRQIETGFEGIMNQSIETSLTSIGIKLKRNKQILDQVAQQSTQFSPTNEYRLGVLELQRAKQLAEMVELEFDRQYLEQAKKNLAEFTSQFISVQILSESHEPPPHRSPMKVVVIAVIASFMVSVLAAIILDQVSRLKEELSRNKMNSSQDL
ncbi:MAG TPA: hypothetical protein DDZ80_22880 [Cyanobacteria bacterium UBA8803]|nr:hypothetical protein [Cyanobacteria bacterium UBA9273]HBL61172.1 hypothetical protein [Cyanobacteria bacterium UBA8803]